MNAMEQQEKDRLAQLGKDRKLAEAVDSLDLMASMFVGVAGDSNSTDEAIAQAASEYRAAVDRRNRCFDDAAGVTPGEGGPSIVQEIDENALREQVATLVDEAIAKREQDAAKAPAAPPEGGQGDAAAKGGAAK